MPVDPQLLGPVILYVLVFVTGVDSSIGAERVASLLEGPESCLTCFITRNEVLYLVLKAKQKWCGHLADE